MNKTAFIVALSITALTSTAAFAASPVRFATVSRLSTGKWVKVGVEKSGIYEISYTALKEMGFSDPSKVGVLGRGGRQMDTEFIDEEGNPLNPDDLSPIAVYHYGERIYFYGQGVESFSFVTEPTFPTKGYYSRVSRNIYSDLGYYFLSDKAGSRVDMEVTAYNPESKELTSGISWIWHEEDLEQNTSHSGQLFWGERFNHGNLSRREWTYEIPGLLTNVTGSMQCDFYSERLTEGTLEWGVYGSDDIRSGSTRNYNSLKFRPQEPMIHTVTINDPQFKVFVDYKSDNNLKGVANLDFWSMTYGRSIPQLQGENGKNLPQEHIGFPSLISEAKINLDAIPGAVIFNVSDPLFPTVSLPSESDGRIYAAVKPAGNVTDIFIADLLRPQLQVKGYANADSGVDNQDLHALGKEGASLLIITSPALKEQGERLANIHREHDGIRVAVATTEEVYNEFSAGVPDPMAYRTFAKMLYESGGEKLRNILLLGQLTSDFRGIDVKRNPENFIIAFQCNDGEPEKGFANANDFLGMMSDRLSNSRLERCRVDVGVGILPCVSASEADAYINKVERYLSDDSFAYRLNRMTNIGGLGDRHVHDNQAIELGSYLSTSTSGHLITSPIIIDAYGSEEAGKKFVGAFDEGMNLITYFGHGGPSLLGKTKDFFTAADVSRLSNRHYPFMVFAGCVLSNFDRGIHGIAEKMVLGHESGLIGAVLATRDTWSGENMDLVKIIYNRMYKDGNSIISPRLSQPLTIGEIYARAKNQSEYANELSYQLLADPALIVPTATREFECRNVSKEIIPGHEITLTGDVTKMDGKNDTAFNGEVIARLMYPVKEIESMDLDTDSREDGDTLIVPYSDLQATMAAGNVKNGKFSVTLKVPDSMSSYDGKEVSLYLCAYDKDRRTGAASRLTSTVSLQTSTGIVKTDRIAPVIKEMRYNDIDGTLDITVSDNSGLDYSTEGRSSSFILSLDGKTLRQGSDALRRITPGEIGYSVSIPLYRIEEGKHSARLEVTDTDGNTAVKEILFEINGQNLISLSMLSEAAYEEAIFTTEGVPENATIEIRDSDGRPVRSLSVTSAQTIWNLTNTDGNRVLPGLYKATLREVRTGVSARSSQAIDVPVISNGERQ